MFYLKLEKKSLQRFSFLQCVAWFPPSLQVQFSVWAQSYTGPIQWVTEYEFDSTETCVSWKRGCDSAKTCFLKQYGLPEDDSACRVHRSVYCTEYSLPASQRCYSSHPPSPSASPRPRMTSLSLARQPTHIWKLQKWTRGIPSATERPNKGRAWLGFGSKEGGECFSFLLPQRLWKG